MEKVKKQTNKDDRKQELHNTEHQACEQINTINNFRSIILIIIIVIVIIVERPVRMRNLVFDIKGGTQAEGV
jgi:hypothetical protein